MTLLERYVGAVKSYLPKAQQDDIAQELAENIQAQMDARSEALGRPLTEAEQEAILQQHGHPMIMAARYTGNAGSFVFGRQLIGATLFPFYTRVLRFNLGISFAIYVIVVVALALSGNPVTVDGMLNAILLQVCIQFAIVTGIFVVAERSLPSLPWNAQRPPALPSLAPKQQVVSRLESSAQIIALVILLGWLRALSAHPALLFGPVADTYQLSPVWGQVAPPTVAIFVIFIAQSIVNLIRPDWTQLRAATRVIADVISLAIIAYVLRAGSWIALISPGGASGNALSAINEYVGYGLWATLIGAAIVALVDVWRLVSNSQKSVA